MYKKTNELEQGIRLFKIHCQPLVWIFSDRKCLSQTYNNKFGFYPYKVQSNKGKIAWEIQTTMLFMA